MSEERACKHCQYWLQQAADDISGQCRRFPPSLAHTEKQQASLEETGAGGFTGAWPETLGVDWCGEFLPREAGPDDGRLEELGLSGRAEGCLRRANITTIRDLARRSAEELRAIRNFGDACLREVQQKMGDRGLRLRE
jgi:hypothetical protein